MGKKALLLSSIVSITEPPPPGQCEALLKRLEKIIRSPLSTSDQVARAWYRAGELGDLQLAYDGHRRQLADCQVEYEQHFVHFAYHVELFWSFVGIATAQSEPDVVEQLQAEAMELLEGAIALGKRVWKHCPVPADDEPDAPIRLMMNLHMHLAIAQQQLGFPATVVRQTHDEAMRWPLVYRHTHD